MILQMKILKKILKENKQFFLIFLCIIILDLIFFMVSTNNNYLDEFYTLIGYPSANMNSINTFIILYQEIFVFYIIFLFLRYDFSASASNIILRITSKKWFFHKMTISYIFIFLLKITQFLLIYSYFFQQVPFHLSYLFLPIIYTFLILAFFFFNITISRNKITFIIVFLLEVSLLIYFYQHFSLILFLILIIVLTIYSYFQFKTKKTVLANFDR